jgi:hypothetical protein
VAFYSNQVVIDGIFNVLSEVLRSEGQRLPPGKLLRSDGRASLLVEFVFGLLHLIPKEHSVKIVEEGIRWNYTTWLNIGFLIVSALLTYRFLRTGGPEMLRMMGSSAEHSDGQGTHQRQ